MNNRRSFLFGVVSAAVAAPVVTKGIAEGGNVAPPIQTPHAMLKEMPNHYARYSFEKHIDELGMATVLGAVFPNVG